MERRKIYLVPLNVHWTLGGRRGSGELLEDVMEYLLLAECEVRTASYGPSFSLPFMAKART